MTVSTERLEALLAAYGADPARWPEDEQAAARELLDTPSLAARIASERRLDAMLDTWESSVQPLSGAAFGPLPARNPVDRLIEWLLPADGDLRTFLRPALVATLPLVLGIVLGGTINLGTLDPYSEVSDTVEDELVLMALTDLAEE